jgi:hypothetical protein
VLACSSNELGVLFNTGKQVTGQPNGVVHAVHVCSHATCNWTASRTPVVAHVKALARVTIGIEHLKLGEDVEYLPPCCWLRILSAVLYWVQWCARQWVKKMWKVVTTINWLWWRGWLWMWNDLCGRTTNPPEVVAQRGFPVEEPQEEDADDAASQPESEPSGLERCFGGNIRMHLPSGRDQMLARSTCRAPVVKDDTGGVIQTLYLLKCDSHNSELERFRNDQDGLVYPPLCKDCKTTYTSVQLVLKCVKDKCPNVAAMVKEGFRVCAQHERGDSPQVKTAGAVHFAATTAPVDAEELEVPSLPTVVGPTPGEAEHGEVRGRDPTPKQSVQIVDTVRGKRTASAEKGVVRQPTPPPKRSRSTPPATPDSAERRFQLEMEVRMLGNEDSAEAAADMSEGGQVVTLSNVWFRASVLWQRGSGDRQGVYVLFKAVGSPAVAIRSWPWESASDSLRFPDTKRVTAFIPALNWSVHVPLEVVLPTTGSFLPAGPKHGRRMHPSCWRPLQKGRLTSWRRELGRSPSTPLPSARERHSVEDTGGTLPSTRMG